MSQIVRATDSSLTVTVSPDGRFQAEFYGMPQDEATLLLSQALSHAQLNAQRTQLEQQKRADAQRWQRLAQNAQPFIYLGILALSVILIGLIATSEPQQQHTGASHALITG